MFCNSAITPASPLIRKVHHPAIDSMVLSLQHRDFVAEVGKCGSRSLDLLFLVLWPSIFFTASPSMSSSRTYEHFSKTLVRCNVFLWLYSNKIHSSVLWSTFLCFLRQVSSRLRRRRLESISPLPCNTFVVCVHDHMVNLRRFHQTLPPRMMPQKLLNLAARMLELTERRCQRQNCMEAVHRISPIPQD